MSSPAASRHLIRAVIFDIGGILEPPFDDVLAPEMARMLDLSMSRLRQRRAAVAVELTDGRMTLREFYAGLAAEGGSRVSPDAVVARHLEVYGAATGRLDIQVLTLIRELRRRHVVACLTNTEAEVARFNRERGLFGHFDRAFLSTELGLHKPSRAIFERVLAELGCAPTEAVFTDDKPENAEAARAVHMHSIHYVGFEEFARELGRLVGRGA